MEYCVEVRESVTMFAILPKNPKKNPAKNHAITCNTTLFINL